MKRHEPDPPPRRDPRRRCSRVFATDGAVESGTLQALKAIRAELIDPTIAVHNGRLVKTTGDGLLVEFGSVVDALRTATEVQTSMAERNTTAPVDERIELRIGINVGDVWSRRATSSVMASISWRGSKARQKPGGICVSARVQGDAAGKLVIWAFLEYPNAYRWMPAALGQLGQFGEAKAALEQVIEIGPSQLDTRVRRRASWHRPEDHAHMLEGLRKAGIVGSKRFGRRHFWPGCSF